MLAALLLAHKEMEPRPKAATESDEQMQPAALKPNSQVSKIELVQEPLELGSLNSEHSLRSLIERAALARRLCVCEGQHTSAAKQIEQCIDCGHTACTHCSGQPEHVYQPYTAERTNLANFRALLISALPMRISMDGFGRTVDAAVAAAAANGESTESPIWRVWAKALATLDGATFHFRLLSRTEVFPMQPPPVGRACQVRVAVLRSGLASNVRYIRRLSRARAEWRVVRMAPSTEARGATSSLPLPRCPIFYLADRSP
jgi:hypothetical protein